MKVRDVARLSTEARFLYWIKERHQIYLRRKAGKPNPWTDDEVLQSYFFTNPYRENDKTTVWFRETVREPLRNDPKVLFATVCFRWFNYIPTGEYLHSHGYLYQWNRAIVNRQLSASQSRGEKVFTGAYMIKAGNGPRGCKVPNVCSAISSLWKKRKQLIKVCELDCRLEALWQELKQFKFLGGFMSYEIVCDLRHTYLLGGASDVDTWCNPGPGAKRGMNRLLGTGNLKQAIPKKMWGAMTEMLLKKVRHLRLEPRVEMREVEHSLCEWDKYERISKQEGRSKRKFKGA